MCGSGEFEGPKVFQFEDRGKLVPTLYLQGVYFRMLESWTCIYTLNVATLHYYKICLQGQSLPLQAYVLHENRTPLNFQLELPMRAELKDKAPPNV